jgi:cytoskeleton protein RodZ
MAFLRRMTVPFAQEALEVEALPRLGPRSAGDMLRQRREALGLDLADVAAALRIKPAYLAALEAGRPDQLPGPVYAIGFVRAYGDHLGLDGGEVLRRFKAGPPVLDTKPGLSFPMPLGERSTPGGTMLLVALILTLCAYATWYYLSNAERSRPERVAEVPASLLPPEQRPIESAVSHSTEALAGPGVAALAAETPAPPDSVGASIPPPQDMAQTAAIAPASSPSQNTSGTADGPARIIIRAIADSWIQIRDANQSVLLARVLKAGDSYGVPDRPGVSMRTGNAGGLDITVDGKPVPSIGRMGAVRRNVALDPQALIAGTAVHP